MDPHAGCCVPAARRAPAIAARPGTGAGGPRPALLALPGGTFRMGNDDDRAIPGDREGPVRAVTVAPFAIAACATTVADWAAFASATGYATVAEREGWSFVFGGLLPDDTPPTRGLAAAPWWRQVLGADWAHPEGPRSDVADRQDHPVVHVSRDDAMAYCAWAGVRLPTEPEWEYAARGGLDGARYPWGDELHPGGEHRCNVWQGEFPTRNTADDGWVGTCPVEAFEPNGFGLHNTSGNAWEWTADPFHPEAPAGPAAMRGGSHLCHVSYCERYRVAARTGSPADSTSGNVSFRVAA